MINRHRPGPGESVIDPFTQKSEYQLIQISRHVLTGTRSVHDPAVRQRPCEAQIFIPLPIRFRKRHLLLARLQHSGRHIQHNDKVWSRNKPPEHVDQPHRAAIAVAPRIHEHIDEMAIVKRELAPG